MKTILSIVALLAAIPAALAAGTCVEDMDYCGSTLVKMGWTAAELRDIAYEDSFNHTRSLFFCVDEDRVEYVETCDHGCYETQEDRSDFCMAERRK